jgi:hypothetical protein
VHDDYWALREDGYGADVPVADLSDDRGGRRRGPGPRARRIAALLLVASVVVAGFVFAAHATDGANNTRRRVEPGPHENAKISDGQARVDVLSALSSTTASGSFHIRFRLSAEPGASTFVTPTTCPEFVGTEGNVPNTYAIGADIVVPCGDYGNPGNTSMTISGEGVVHVDPTAMVTTAQVPNLGEITTRVDGTRVWEDGGANYGMMPSSDNGPGAPLSEFASLVMGTLGRREGAIAMSSLASPTGYLDIAKESIAASSKLDDAVVEGVPVHVYEVAIDTMKSLDRPGLTSEETKATSAALKTLAEEGYKTTTVRLSIDGLGFIRQAHTVFGFDDGGTVTGDTTFSDFGCASVVLLANGPSIVDNPNGCAPAPTTTASAPALSVGPSTVAAPVPPPEIAPSTTAEAPVSP